MIRTCGIGESWLADKIREWEEQLPSHMRLAYLPGLGEVKLRITAFGDNRESLEKEVEEQSRRVLPLIEKWVYGYKNDSLALAVGKLLLNENKTVGIAESCTGGYVSYLLTSEAGSSRYFNGSIVAYSNEIKESAVGVQKDSLMEFGAVSKQTAREMAEGARKALNTDYGLSATGIAGPGGGSPEKPVGLVWIAISNGTHTITKKLNLSKERDTNIRYTAIALLNLFRQTLTENGWESQ